MQPCPQRLLRHSVTGALIDLEERIQVGKEAVYATPVDHPYRRAHLTGLGILFGLDT